MLKSFKRINVYLFLFFIIIRILKNKILDSEEISEFKNTIDFSQKLNTLVAFKSNI